jgi:hypothetical protein
VLGGVVGERDRDARRSVEVAEIVNGFADRQLLRRGEVRDDGRVGGAAHEQVRITERERERVRRQGGRQDVVRCEALRRMHEEKFARLRESGGSPRPKTFNDRSNRRAPQGRSWKTHGRARA